MRPAAPVKHKRLIRSKDDRIVDFIAYAVGALVVLVTLYPLVFVVSASFSDPARVINGEITLLPKGFTLEGYKRILNYSLIWKGYRNTFLYTLFGTSVNLAVTLPAAYALSRRDFIGRNALTAFFAFTMFFSGGLIPTYLVMKTLRLVNSPLIMVFMGAVSVWNTVIARTFFQGNIPLELQEAAYLDGCSTTQLFLRVVLPLAKPIIAVLALFCAVGHWNSYFNALIYLSNANTYPLQIFLRNILILNQMDAMMMGDPDSMEFLLRMMQLKESMKFGIVVVASVPVLALYPFLQKYFVKGMMVGALKG
ncbi:MAG: carbohydrate ABC transporter permease [Oscillospiraceae bacterium]|nr:carbohydrate ABC transporter permease [Oscillospiraceae bacterium]